MSTSLDDLAGLVNLESGNSNDRGSATAVGTDDSVEYLIAPPFRTIVDDADFAFYVDGELDQTGHMDFSNGVYTDRVARPGSALSWKFNYVYWTKAQVFAAVNAGIGMLFPAFYRTVIETIVTDGDSREFTLTTPLVEELRYWQFSSDGTKFSYKKREEVELDYDGEDTIVRFFSAPQSGSAALSLVCRPSELPTNEDVLDIPDRASAPIVSYALFHLLNQKQAPRLRSDIAIATVGGGNLSPRQMNDASNSFYLRYQLQLEHLKMRPWRTR